LITASADRTIKLWEPSNVKSNPCFQTIVGHEGSILDMVYIEKVNQLITSSTDRTMRIWVIDQSRQLLYYPWFVINQRIQDFTSINLTQDMDVWINCIAVQDEEKLFVHAGDSEGSILTFKASDDWRQKCEFSLGDDKKRGLHKFGLLQILDLTKKESCQFTIGYDQYVNGYGKNKERFFNYPNPNKVLFTSMCWDDEGKLLYIADELGYVYIAHVYLAERETIQKKVTKDKIKSIEVYSTASLGSILFVFTERSMQAFRIKIG